MKPITAIATFITAFALPLLVPVARAEAPPSASPEAAWLKSLKTRCAAFKAAGWMLTPKGLPQSTPARAKRCPTVQARCEMLTTTKLDDLIAGCRPQTFRHHGKPTPPTAPYVARKPFWPCRAELGDPAWRMLDWQTCMKACSAAGKTGLHILKLYDKVGHRPARYAMARNDFEKGCVQRWNKALAKPERAKLDHCRPWDKLQKYARSIAQIVARDPAMRQPLWRWRAPGLPRLNGGTVAGKKRWLLAHKTLAEKVGKCSTTSAAAKEAAMILLKRTLNPDLERIAKDEAKALATAPAARGQRAQRAGKQVARWCESIVR